MNDRSFSANALRRLLSQSPAKGVALRWDHGQSQVVAARLCGARRCYELLRLLSLVFEASFAPAHGAIATSPFRYVGRIRANSATHG